MNMSVKCRRISTYYQPGQFFLLDRFAAVRWQINNKTTRSQEKMDAACEFNHGKGQYQLYLEETHCPDGMSQIWLAMIQS